MATWRQFMEEAPELAGAVERRFGAHRHKVMASVRADGSPRLCGTEVELVAGELWIGGMAGARRFADLRRDPRVAVHSGSDEPDRWSGDARLDGRAVETASGPDRERYLAALDDEPPGPFELFRVELTEAMVIALDDARTGLVIRVWRPGAGVRTILRE